MDKKKKTKKHLHLVNSDTSLNNETNKPAENNDTEDIVNSDMVSNEKDVNKMRNTETDTDTSEVFVESDVNDLPVKKTVKKRRMSVANVIFRIILLIALIALVVYGIKALVTFSISLEPETIKNAKVEDISLTTNGTLAYDNFHRGVIVANNGNVGYYNSKADLLWEVPGFDGSPIIDVADRYALVSYTGTPNALLFNGPDSIPITGNGNIVTSCINENGYFALVMTEEGYKNQIVVFDSNAQVIYRWHSAESFVTCVSISPDNSGMTASTVNFNNGSFAGSVLIFNFNQDKPFTGQVEDDNLIMDIEYVSDKRLVVIGDKYSSIYKINGDKISNIDYNGKKLTTFDVCDDGHTILCFAKDDSFMSNSDIYSYTSKGKQLGHYETNGRALSVSCSNKRILVARERQFDLLSEKCDKVATMAVVKDIKNSVLFDKGRYAFSVSGNSAQIIKVR